MYRLRSVSLFLAICAWVSGTTLLAQAHLSAARTAGVNGAVASDDFGRDAVSPQPVPSTAELIVSQVNWLNALTGYVYTANGNPAGGSIAIDANGDIVVADSYSLLLVNHVTGAKTTLGPWTNANAVAIDAKNDIYVGNLYGPPTVLVRVPYVSGTYAAFTTPTTSTPACTAASTVECVVKGAGAITPGAMAFDAAGDLFWVTSGDGLTSANAIWKCTSACLGGTGSPVLVYQEPKASKPPSAASGQLLAGSLAVDPWGNLFFTDASLYVNTTTYGITGFYSHLNELPVSSGAGYGGKKTGYAASPTILYTLPDPSAYPYDSWIDGVAINKTTGTVYFGDTGHGVFAFPNTGGAITLANGQPTSLYAVSAQGAKTLAIDSQGNLYLALYNTLINTGGADTLAQVTLNKVIVPGSQVGVAVSPSATLNPVTTLLNDAGCSSRPSPYADFSGASDTAEAAVATTGACSGTLSGGSAFDTTVSFTPEAAGVDTISLTAVDQSSHSASVTVTGVGAHAAAIPTFSPAQGSYSSTQSVTIKDATTGATIYYTTSGVTPTTASTRYTAPITVSTSETIKAIATAPGYSQSAIASATYYIGPITAEPTITSVAEQNKAVLVKLSQAAGGTIYYTLDGSTPTPNSQIYQGPFLVASNLTVKAIATTAAHAPSAVASKTFTLNIPSGTLVWSDEFTNTGKTRLQPNPATWTYDTGNSGFGNNELEDYCAWNSSLSPCNPANPNAYVDTNSALHIVARKPSTGVYTSARMKSQVLFSFQYGRLEVRAQVPEGQGFWPAIWMLGNNIDTVNWPACGEQDMVERVDAAASPDWNAGSVHGTGFTGANLGTNYYFPSGQTAAGWHTYGMIWKPGSISYYVDNPASPYATYTPASLNSLSGAVWPFDTGPSFLILNVAVGGSWPGSPNSTTPFPSQMVVDYVRIYTN